MERSAASRPEPVERGDRRCRICGRVHDAYRKDRGRSWADPDDGHYYTPESWEEVAKRYGYSPERERDRADAAEAGRLAVTEHTDVLRKLAEDD